MPEYDLVIRGGTFIDGTGVPRYRADVAVKAGRVAKVASRVPGQGAKELDASGCIVGTGAIDLHTHYDAQLNWDPYATLSGWHGVTSLTVGECGFGFAPTKPADRDLAMRMMNRIEAIPLESMRKGMRWDWESLPEYMDSLERQGLGVNVGVMVPFSPLRGYVLGMIPARERKTVDEREMTQMKQLFYEAMRAGAFGFSLDKNMEDRPEDGSFLPSHVASDEEFLALSEVLAQFDVGHIGMTIGFGYHEHERAGIRGLVRRMLEVSGRPAHVLDTQIREEMDWVLACRKDGLPLMVQQSASVSMGQRFKLSEYNMFDYMPNWVQPLVGTAQERGAKLRDQATRERMKQDAKDWPNIRTDWATVLVREAAQQRNERFEGMTINEVASATGKEPLDAFLDLALDEGLETEFHVPPTTSTPEQMRLRGQVMKEPYVHISMSDGGAHTRFLTLSTWPVWWLSYWARDLGLVSLEEAHFKMSALPAWLTDFKHRGTLRVGDWADVIVYKLDELGFQHERPIFANDFPGGERRIIQKPKGMRYILVNGVPTFEENVCTNALPGRLLRSYEGA